MTKKLFLFAGVSIVLLGQATAQIRYQDDVFTRAQVQVSNNVVFGDNYYFLNYPPAPNGTSSSNPQLGPLQMDVYTPPGSDTAQERPLVIYVHTGSFLPKYFNGQATGKKDDSTVVELCNRFVMKGYVAAAINYRLGWNPLAPTQTERTQQILNAVYRAIHDVQTAVRFFKKDAATTNTYKINPDRIFLIGQGSGGYITFAYQFLDKQSETELPKFLDGQGNSVVNPALVGYVDGTGGTFNNYNHPGYSNDVCMIMNLSGCMGDISWMDQQWPRVPVAGIHARKDMFAPVDSGNVIVPVTGQVVVFVHGTRAVVSRAVSQGLNDIWINHTFTDPYSARAYSLNPKITHEGFLQLEIPDVPNSTNQEGSPWEWWDSTAVTNEALAQSSPYAMTLHTSGLSTNPDMSKTKALAYVDTILGFFVPRMYLVLQDPTVGVESVEQPVDLALYPNPTSDMVMLSTKGNNQIETIEVTDLNGRVLFRKDNIFSTTYTLYRQALPGGTYLVGIKTSEGNVMRRIILQ